MTDSPAPIGVEHHGDVAVVSLDDGKANAVSHDLVRRFHEILDDAADARAVVIVGRPGRFSAGFDLAVMGQGMEAATELVGAGGRLLMRLFGHPRPVVAACTGHALAAGALLLLSTDTRIGAAGPFKIGLNETAIGMPLPQYAVELARDRLAPTHYTRSAVQAEVYDPEGAVAAGYLDRVVDADSVVAEAVAEGQRLGSFSTGAYAATKTKSRQGIIERTLAGLDEDLRAFAASG
jgi:enoyl-CoA hydratase